MAGCLEEGTVLAFLGGSLAPAVRSTVEAHIADCSACADLVTWAAADQASPTGLSGIVGRPFVGQLQPGARVGRYQVLGALGRGGMGEVYAAYHPELDRRIALKVVQGFDGGSGPRRSRLLREARAIARLSHPNVVTVHDAGTFGDRVFIAMELIDGQTIEQWLRAERRTWQAILEVFLAAGRGLAAAHAAGVVHRDFKPQNVMIAKDGIVRVMDFGLARVADEEQGEGSAGDGAPKIPVGVITKTGAFIGTPAYMSPEQFRREATDARSDQFSFCIALHEALFGTRPATASAEAGSPMTDVDARSPRRTNVPGWLRQIVLRGAAPNREQRYPSMHALLTAFERARSRTRRRLLVIATAMTVLLLSGGGWRLAHGNRFVCAVPKDRVAAAWAPGDTANPRRRSMQNAFAASARASGEGSWQRVSKVLDEYMTAWNTMYVQTCEATHTRGEQSAEILDLRMSCLNDNLDQVRSLTETFAAADKDVVSRAVSASHKLTPVSRCADIALLKSAIPLPRDEKTLGEVIRLRRSVAKIATLREVGKYRRALAEASALRARVDATAYKPLMADLLHEIGLIETCVDEDPSRAEPTLVAAVVLAEAAGDDVTAAKAVTSLVFLVGFRLGRPREAEIWVSLGHAILDRIGKGQEVVRGWLVGNETGLRLRAGDFEAARTLQQRATALFENTVGEAHPYFGAALSNLSYVLTLGGHAEEALAVANRAIDVMLAIDSEPFPLAGAYSNQGDALQALGKYSQAAQAYDKALPLFELEVGSMHPERAFALHGLGTTKLAMGFPTTAIPLLSLALEIRKQPGGDPVLAAETQFALARALWQSNGDRRRARTLATEALKVYRDTRRTERQHGVEVWLANHPSRSNGTLLRKT